MKYMLIIASAVALAVASPQRGLVNPGAAGPAPAPVYEPIASGPAMLDYEPVAIGPEFVEQPVAAAPAPVFPEDIAPPVAPTPVGNPIIQIILNINGHVSDPVTVVPMPPIEIIPDPIDVVDSAPEPVDIGPAFVPEPVDIGVPILPVPAENLPEQLN